MARASGAPVFNFGGLRFKTIRQQCSSAAAVKRDGLFICGGSGEHVYILITEMRGNGGLPGGVQLVERWYLCRRESSRTGGRTPGHRTSDIETLLVKPSSTLP
ncbi:hypothetical protein J6590_006462 [Homalodisca vitripennis]|nr:hypothetical protein J6590_006462 [Homalodisca vitripennis]